MFYVLRLQTMYNIIYLGMFRFINMGFATVFITVRTIVYKIKTIEYNDRAIEYNVRTLKYKVRYK